MSVFVVTLISSMYSFIAVIQQCLFSVLLTTDKTNPFPNGSFGTP